MFRGIDGPGVISNRGLHPDAVRKILTKRAAQAGIKVPSGERLSQGRRMKFTDNLLSDFCAGACSLDGSRFQHCSRIGER